MIKDRILNDYFEWLYELICGDGRTRYRKLFTYLHSVEFIPSFPRDENRAADGISLRWRFCVDNHYDNDICDYIDGPCSVLEMIIALAVKAEDLMDDERYGDRAPQWFFGMLRSLGIFGMTDEKFDEKFTEKIILRFLNREYEPNGKGGLFTLKRCDKDLTKVEIWHQLCWFLDQVIGIDY